MHGMALVVAATLFSTVLGIPAAATSPGTQQGTGWFGLNVTVFQDPLLSGKPVLISSEGKLGAFEKGSRPIFSLNDHGVLAVRDTHQLIGVLPDDSLIAGDWGTPGFLNDGEPLLNPKHSSWWVCKDDSSLYIARPKNCQNPAAVTVISVTP